MGLKAGGLDHADLWRITMHEQTRRRNTEKEIEYALEVLPEIVERLRSISPLYEGAPLAGHGA